MPQKQTLHRSCPRSSPRSAVNDRSVVNLHTQYAKGKYVAFCDLRLFRPYVGMFGETEK